jgi:hypothetical protein
LKSPYLVLACERPWHDHSEMTKSIGPILANFGTPNKVMTNADKHVWPMLVISGDTFDMPHGGLFGLRIFFHIMVFLD